jgi:hypothetical protein
MVSLETCFTEVHVSTEPERLRAKQCTSLVFLELERMRSVLRTCSEDKVDTTNSKLQKSSAGGWLQWVAGHACQAGLSE